MNPKPIFNLFSLKGMTQTVIPRQMSIRVLSLAMLSLFMLTAHVQEASADAPVNKKGPSQAIVPVAAIENEATSDSAYLAANPELLKIDLPADVPAMTEADFLAANPELRFARSRLVASITTDIDATTLAANPELPRARPVWSPSTICARWLASKSELRIAHRYTSAIQNEDSQLGTY